MDLTLELIVGIIACLVTMGTVIAGAVWTVGRIQGATEALRQSIEHLAQAVESIRLWVGEVAAITHRHGERLARLEAKMDVCDEEE